MRSKFEGVLVVYRAWSMGPSSVKRFSAEVMVGDSKTFYYYHAPKSFMDLVEDGSTMRHVRVSFTANQDGSNPRSVVKLSDPY